MADLVDKYIKLRKTMKVLEDKRRELEEELLKHVDLEQPVYRGDARISAYSMEVWEYDDDTKYALKSLRAENNKEVRAVQLKAQIEGRGTSKEVTRIKFEQGK